MSKIIAIASLRGGVGKTMSTMNLAAALSELGKKVLAVDFDRQRNLSFLYEKEKIVEFDFASSDLFSSMMTEKYDYIFIDTEPGLGTETVEALSMADEVMIPVVPGMWDISGVQDYETVVSKINEDRNHKLKIAGIFLTMCEGEDLVPSELPVFKTRIPKAAAQDERLVKAYKELALECLKKQ